MKRIELQSKTNSAKINELLRYFNQIAPRITNSVGVHIPPICFSGFCPVPVDGLLYKEMFPVKGKLNQVLVHITDVDDSFSGALISVEVHHVDGTVVKQTATCGRNLVRIEMATPIYAGSKLFVRLMGDAIIGDIWIAGTYDIKMSSSTLHEVMWEELEKVYEGI